MIFALATLGTRGDVEPCAAIARELQRRLRLRVSGLDLDTTDMHGVGQSLVQDVIEIRDPRTLTAEPAPADLPAYLKPQPFVESDDLWSNSHWPTLLSICTRVAFVLIK